MLVGSFFEPKITWMGSGTCSVLALADTRGGRVKTLQRMFLGLAVAGSVALAGCGGGGSFSCNDKGNCPNDTVPTQAAVNACVAAQAGTCGSQFKAAGSCAKDHASCGSNGKSTTDLNACAAQFGAFFQCCQSNPTTDGCHT